MGWTTHHDRLALVLNDMAGPTDLISASQTQEHELVGRVDRIFVDGRHGGELPFRRHLRLYAR